MNLEEAPVIGRIGPRPDGLDAPFWDALAAGRLKLQRCQYCRTWIFGPQWICPSCHRPEPGWEEVEPRGTVYSWTRTHQPFAAEFAETTPYVTVVVELGGADGRRLAGVLLGDQGVDPTIGDEVVGVIQPVGDVSVLRWRSSVDDSPSAS